MNLSFFYFSFILFIFLSIIDSTQVDIQCPTSRRLLLFGGGEKTSSRSSSSSKSLSSSPPKYARSSDSHGLTVYIQPQTSAELGRKVRSYTHLLKSKLRTTNDKTRSKRSQSTKKKSSKKKTSLPVAKTQELATTNTDELQRCQALLQIDSTATIDEKKKKKVNKTITATKPKNSPTPTSNSLKTDKKVKSNEQRSKPSKTNENRPVSSSANDLPKKASSSESTSQPKNKRTKADTITIIQQTTIPFNTDENEIDEKNHSVVNRAFHFMKNIFQLSENLLEDNPSEDDSVIHMSNDHHHSRKLLSIIEDEDEAWTNLGISECEVDRSSFAVTSLSKRQLLSVKTNKQSTSSKSTNTKEKKQKSLAKTDDNKPKVGWAYRYRISRYLAAQKMKRSGSKGKAENEDSKKKLESMTSKVSKRKLLVHSDNDQSSCQKDQISDESVLITETFHPKRQLLSSKTKDHTLKTKETTHVDKLKTRRRKKAIENLTDPIVIIQSYERGTYKPHVGWQFRYRVSRYIDSLRETIREDQQRLRVGLQDIKGKKSQEFTGRRKRPTDKPLSSEIDPLDKRQARAEQKKKTTTTTTTTSHRQSHVEVEEESLEGENDLDPELRKINEEGRRVGWTYRYRIRRKLDHLKQIQAETGVPFDLATLGGKREKKRGESKDHSTGKKSPEKTKSVVSKTRDEKKQEKSKKSDQKMTLAPESKSSIKNESKAGWQYRYRIRRKLDSEQNAKPQDTSGGKRGKKSSSPKRKGKDKVTEQASSSIPPSLNTDNDNDDTPVIRYFRRTSSTLLSMAKKSLCLLPRSQPWSFCELENNERNPSTAQSSKPVVTKRLKTKKEHRAKQFIRSHTTKFGAEDKATERRVDETMKKLYKRPSLPPLQTPPITITTHEKPPKKPHRPLLKPGKSNPEEQIPVEKIISVASKKNKNKKQFQIIGQEVKRKPKDLSPPSVGKTTPSPVELPKTTTTPPPRLRTLSEVIQDEAATILAPIRSSSRTPEEIQEEINETNESIQETNQRQRRTTTTTTTTTLIDSTTSGEEDNEATTTTDDDSQINQANKLDLNKNKSSSS